MSRNMDPVFAARLEAQAESAKEAQRWEEEARVAYAQVRTWKRRHKRLGIALACAVLGGLAVSGSLAIAVLVVRGKVPSC